MFICAQSIHENKFYLEKLHFLNLKKLQELALIIYLKEQEKVPVLLQVLQVRFSMVSLNLLNWITFFYPHKEVRI